MPETKIAKRRLELKLSRAAFGSEIGVDVMTVKRWERGDSLPQQRLWPKLEKLTGIPIAEILTDISAVKQREAAE